MKTALEGGVLLSLLLASFLQGAFADAILGCGGFVEAGAALAKLRKPSDPKIDYSHITVELRTLDGLVKDSTQCAPNGYYFVPVYDKGTLIVQIQGPEGWFFEPSQVSVTVDQNGCNNNEDINFRYTGFTLAGKILGGVGGQSCAGEEGPAGVKVTLTTLEGGNPIASVLTTPGGSYKFENLLTGSYKIEASHPDLKVEAKGSEQVELGWGNGKVADIFFVAGYHLEGSVVSQGNPVLGVQVYLYSDEVPELFCPQGPGSATPLSKPALCHAVSDAEGKFSFSGVSCGQYTLVPYYRGENTLFDVSPSSKDISVGHESVKLLEAFQVTGFSVGGRVVDSEGNGLMGVKIEIDDTERATTDSDGYYKLDQVTLTHYTIQARKENYKFSSLQNFKVLPNMAFIPEIKATHYRVCGSVHAVNPIHAQKRQIALTHGPDGVRPQTTPTDDSGSFCFEVPPGDYRLSPVTTAAENASGLIFSPMHMDLTVTKPVLDAVFTQAQVSVSGVVKCKGACSSHVKISLSPSGSLKNEVSLKQVISLSSNKFSFEKVLPGKYTLEIQHKTKGTVEDDDWCWEHKTLEILVGTEDVTGLEFLQKGFWMSVKSTHAVDAFLLQPHNEGLNLKIQKGWQQICLGTPGVHELHFTDPYVFFGAHAFYFDTAKPSPLELVGQKYLLSGEIHIDSALYGAAHLLDDSLIVKVQTHDGQLVNLDNHPRLVSEPNDMNSYAAYAYSHWAAVGEQLTFSAHHRREEESSLPQILFYPRKHHVHVTVEGKQPQIPLFQGRPGIYVKGSVTPALDDVKITVVSEKHSLAGGLKAGEVAVSTVTGSDGTYVAGPLYDDTTYITRAALAGFHLKSLGDNSFSCQKLGQLLVTITPGEGAEEILPSALLSLSGEDGYRKNAATTPSEAYAFTNLFPGSFYLRPLLKEYSFTPSALAIELGSGETKHISFSARRIAHSVFGTVTSLSGKPEEGITLEARSVSRGYYEETVTDSEGKYRLRGLLPSTQYIIKAALKVDRPGLNKIERSSPNGTLVEVNFSDIRGVDFVVFEELPTTIVTGVVEGAQLERLQPNLRVEFSSTTEPRRVERTISLSLSFFFEVQGLPRGKYIARLLFDRNERSHKFVTDAIEVDLETYSTAHIGPLRYTAEEQFNKQELAAAPVVPVVVGVAVIALFASMPRLKDGYQWAIGGGAAAGMSAVKKEATVRKPNARTRRTF
ncbi:uncharacterized protein [Physcomitrium patens]|uniref:Carbohydrate-binding-like fold protein n=1 Tax=Physcomitrium patens TaxID=3218 RepID=A0A2K1JJD6_PHYPA|nr:nodal modulator 3-like [Physcomitrium patens]XP_024394079.1 nodal modulator 3-like [Physcomitrium patens]PNR41661.1 hypothetical protein PHYPA_019066 [Physcomitrium patens]|eukprot:XP_024394078.1 nodal modulator 3-like [Physcomitrella patens]